VTFRNVIRTECYRERERENKSSRGFREEQAWFVAIIPCDTVVPENLIVTQLVTNFYLM
jgi:hypothetical protein